MNNTTTIKIAAKYASMLELVEKDIDGYWAYSLDGYRFTATGCHTVSEATQAQLLSSIKTLESCDCADCLKPVQVEEETITEESKHQVLQVNLQHQLPLLPLLFLSV